MDEHPKYTVEEAKERDATYSTKLHVKVRLFNRETGEIKEPQGETSTENQASTEDDGPGY